LLDRKQKASGSIIIAELGLSLPTKMRKLVGAAFGGIY
jgi:hypothetical protein